MNKLFLLASLAILVILAQAGLTPQSLSTVINKTPAPPTPAADGTLPPDQPSPLDLLATIDKLTKDVASLTQQVANMQANTQAIKPKIMRIYPYELTGHIQNHQQDQSITAYIPIPSGVNVYALLINVFYYHQSTNNHSHGYLSVRMNQQGDTTNYVNFQSRKFNWYANTANEMEIVPWSSSLSNYIELFLHDTYNTEAAGNTYGKCYYIIQLVGYMTY